MRSGRQKKIWVSVPAFSFTVAHPVLRLWEIAACSTVVPSCIRSFRHSSAALTETWSSLRAVNALSHLTCASETVSADWGTSILLSLFKVCDKTCSWVFKACSIFCEALEYELSFSILAERALSSVLVEANLPRSKFVLLTLEDESASVSKVSSLAKVEETSWHRYSTFSWS